MVQVHFEHLSNFETFLRQDTAVTEIFFEYLLLKIDILVRFFVAAAAVQ